MIQRGKTKEQRRIFLSYASEDKQVARRVRTLLSEWANVFTTEKLSARQDWLYKIRDELTKADVFVVVMSPKTMESSWVLQEIGAAWAINKRIVGIATEPSEALRIPEVLVGARNFTSVKMKELESPGVKRKILGTLEADRVSLHDRLIEEFLSASRVSDVLLVARLADPRIGYDDTKEIRVFIPDLHLLTAKEEKRYPYGFNSKDQMVGILNALKRFRRGLGEGEGLTVYQLGDFVDLWRQGRDDATKILAEHHDIAGHLYGSPSSLNPWFLLGDHDLDLPDHGGFGVWNRRYYFPIRDPRVLVLHGDVFDWADYLPDRFEKVYAYMFGPLSDANAYDLENLRKGVKQAHGAKQYKRYIQAEYHEIGDCVSVKQGLPDESYFNVTKVTDPDDPRGHEYMPVAYRCVQRIRGEFGLNITTLVIGHTHHARIAIYEGAAGEFFTLMDCGAWIEKYRTPAEPEPRPNAQIGVMVSNDLRIYQIV